MSKVFIYYWKPFIALKPLMRSFILSEGREISTKNPIWSI